MDTAFGNKLICKTAYSAVCKSAETQNSPVRHIGGTWFDSKIRYKIFRHMIWLWIILGVIVLAIACWVVYISAEHHELHKMRAEFENVEKKLYNYFKSERETASHDGVTFGELPKETVAGAGFAVQKILEMFDKEETEINHELLNYIKKLVKEIYDKH